MVAHRDDPSTPGHACWKASGRQKSLPHTR